MNKSQIDNRYYRDSEILFNILIGTFDIIWCESLKDTEYKFDGKDIFIDSTIGTSSLTELHNIEANIQRKKNIEDLINNGKSSMERKFTVYPDNSTLENGLSISCMIEATFDISNEEFDYDIIFNTNLSEGSFEKYKFLRQRFTERMVIFNTNNIKELHRYFLEQARLYFQEMDREHKPTV